MPNVLIVDDETIFRKGLRHMISNLSEEWIIVGEAKDGLEALEQADKLQPDIVITDISMPRMDGIELQYVLKERYPFTQCIVMSGYNDFDYVRNSFRLGAKDYLLKPVAKDDLVTALEKLKQILGEKQHLKSQHSNADIRIRNQLRQHLLNGLITGQIIPEEIDLLEEVGISFTEGHYCCMIADFDRESIPYERYHSSDPALFSIFIMQFIQELSNELRNSFVFILPDGNVGIIQNFTNAEKGYQQAISFANYILKEIKLISNLTVTISLGNPVNELEKICKSFHEAEIALLSRLYEGGNQLFLYKPKSNNIAIEVSDSIDWVLLEKAVLQSRIDDANNIIERILHKYFVQNTDPTWIQQQVCKMIFRFYEWVAQHHLSNNWFDGAEVKVILNEILKITEKCELIDHCKKIVNSLCLAIQSKASHSVTDPIDFVMNEVRHFYAEPITLSMMAKKVFLNPAYLSTLFKHRTGISFVDFVTQTRIEEAKKQLLGSQKKISTIADDTGFINLRHFHRVFKSKTGCTPNAYRSQQL